MKIFAISNYNNFIGPRMQRVSFGVSNKQTQADTFQKTRKPESFYTLSKMAYSGQNGQIKELFKKPGYNTETLEKLFQMQDKNGRTPLHKALLGASFEGVLKYTQDELETMFLNERIMRGRLQEVVAIRENIQEPPGYLSTVQTMLQPFANNPGMLKKILTVRDFEGQTPIDYAVRLGLDYTRTMLHSLEKYPETMKEVFLDKGHGKSTLLHVLARQPQKQQVIFELIRPFKNDPEALKELLMAQDWRGNTPLHLALKSADADFENVDALLHPLKNNPSVLKELLTVKNDQGKAPFELITYYRDDKVSQVVESYIKIATDADKGEA